MSQEVGSGWMAGYAAHFKTQNTIYTATGAGFVRVLTADPRRWYVQFIGIAGAVVSPMVYPGPMPSPIGATVDAGTVQAYKFRDCPAMVAGEWYVFDDGLLQLLITEQLLEG